MPYITFDDIRDEGIPDPPTDGAITSTIKLVEDIVDRYTRQWFDSRPGTWKLDGGNDDTIHLPVPIIDIEHVRLNDSTTNLEADKFRVYNGRQTPDDRRNPRIKLVTSENPGDIFTAPARFGHRLIFRKGRQNQEIKGNFGFTESDGSAPEAVKRAVKILTIEKLLTPLFDDPSAPSGLPPPAPLLGNIIQEQTDGHMRKYAQAGGSVSDRPSGLSGITDNKEFWDLLRLYRAPISVEITANFTED